MTELDLQSKQRLVGSSIWLLALVIIVPIWYSNPVNFSPDGEEQTSQSVTLPKVDHAYRLPHRTEQPLTDGQALNKSQLNQQQANQNSASYPQTNQSDTQDSAGTSDVSAAINVKIEEPIAQAFIDKVTDNSQYQGQWIVRFQAFNNTKQANEFASRLQGEHPVYIKYFAKTRVYSVRTGPYISRVKAEKAKQKLDKILRTNGEVRQLPKTP